jgi:hypothetical protein
MPLTRKLNLADEGPKWVEREEKPFFDYDAEARLWVVIHFLLRCFPVLCILAMFVLLFMGRTTGVAIAAVGTVSYYIGRRHEHLCPTRDGWG